MLKKAANISKKKAPKAPFYKYLTITLIIMSILVLSLIYFIGVLPVDYFLFAVGLFVVIDGSLILSMNGRHKIKVIGGSLSLIFIIAMILITIYEINTINFLKKFGYNNYFTESYLILVDKDTDYKKLTDLTNKEIGVLKTEADSKALDYLKKKLVFAETLAINNLHLITKLDKSQVAAIMIAASQLNVIKENNPKLLADFKQIYSFEIESKETNIVKDINITEKPFNIYVSGIDTFGKINSIAQSDLNLIVSVNPKTHKVQITSVPRDYYIKMDNQKAYDKLSYISLYGMESATKAIEDLLKIEINYYLRINFNSLIEVVNAVDGIEIESNYNFTSIDELQNPKAYTFKKGLNKLDGNEALAFVREKKAFPAGDKTRSENQQLILKALIDEALSPSVLINYNSLLESLNDSFITNLSNEQLADFIKKQLASEAKWDITMTIMQGWDSTETSFTYLANKISVVIPNLDNVKSTSQNIQKLIND